MYSSSVLDHFRAPRGAGVLEGANARGRAQNPGCGDDVELSLKVEDGRVVEARFRASGCVAAIACASRTTELVRGMSLVEALAVDAGRLSAELEGLPPQSRHAAKICVRALRAALCGAPAVPRANSVLF